MVTIEEMKRWKRILGMTSKEISASSGVPLSTVQKIFSGVTRFPREATLAAILSVLEQKAQAEGNLKESMRINDEWLKTVEKGSHPYALVALYRYIEFKGGTLSPSTIRGYRNVQKNNFSSIMCIKLNKLTVNKIQAAINSEIGSKKPKTLQNDDSLISSYCINSRQCSDI